VLERLGQTREKIPVAPVTVAARYSRPKKWMNIPQASRYLPAL
jgi:hypothetical protein